MMQHQPTFFFTSSGLTDIGSVRSMNEDNLLLSPETGLWVIADGAGGHSNGDVASSLIVENLLDYEPSGRLGNDINAIYKILNDTNTHLVEIAGTKKIIGSTVTAFITNGHSAFVVWAGDSPLFLLRDGKLSQAIEDHNRVDEFIRRGFTEEECRTIPQAQQLVRALGASKPLVVETRMLPLKNQDLYLICSDGLTKELSEKDIEAVLLTSTSLEDMNHTLLEKAISKGARDNISIILIKLDNKSINQV